MSAASQGSLTESERFKYPSRFAVCDRPTRLGSDARPPTPIGSPLASASTFAPEPLKSRPLMITSEPASEAGSKSMVSPLIEVAGIRNRSVPLVVNASATIRVEKPFAGPETKDSTRPPKVPLKLPKLLLLMSVNGRGAKSVSYTHLTLPTILLV